jgi:hypothetical protein
VDVPTSTSARNTSISSPRHHNHDAVGGNTAVNDYKGDCHENVKRQLHNVNLGLTNGLPAVVETCIVIYIYYGRLTMR